MFKNEIEIEKANTMYFQTLANTNASMYQLQIGLVVVVPLGLVLAWILNQIGIYNQTNNTVLLNITIALTMIMALVSVFSFSPKLLFKFQVFFSFMISLMLIIMAYIIIGLAYIISIVDFKQGDNVLSPNLYTQALSIMAVLILTASTIINIYLLQKRLKNGISETQNQKDILVVIKRVLSSRFMVILALVVIIPNIVTMGAFLTNTVGIILLTFFCIVFPNPIVEFTYLAYLKIKDKKYWQEMIEEEIETPVEKRTKLVEIAKVIYIVLTLLYMYYLSTIYEDGSYPVIISISILLILISWVVILVMWILKKARN